MRIFASCHCLCVYVAEIREFHFHPCVFKTVTTQSYLVMLLFFSLAKTWCITRRNPTGSDCVCNLHVTPSHRLIPIPIKVGRLTDFERTSLFKPRRRSPSVSHSVILGCLSPALLSHEWYDDARVLPVTPNEPAQEANIILYNYTNNNTDTCTEII